MSIRKKSGISTSAVAALLGDSLENLVLESPQDLESATPFRFIDVDMIDPNPYQPRTIFAHEELENLASSIKTFGVRSPIEIREHPEHPDRFQIVSGERRLRASKMAGLSQIPALLVKESDIDTLSLALIENLQRQDLNLLEEALGYERLRFNFFLTLEQIAEKVGKNRSTISHILRILNLPSDLRSHMESGVLTLGHAKILLGIPEKQQLRLGLQCAGENWSLQVLKEHAGKLSEGSVPKTEPSLGHPINPGHHELPLPQDSAGLSRESYWDDIEDDLRSHLGTQVRITQKKSGGGTILIEFYDADGLSGLLETMNVPQRTM